MLACFREVILQSGESGIADLLPLEDETTHQIEANGADDARLTQAFSIAFQLLSMCEQNAAVHYRGEAEEQEGLASVPALWTDVLRSLTKNGWSPSDIASEMQCILVPTLWWAYRGEAPERAKSA